MPDFGNARQTSPPLAAKWKSRTYKRGAPCNRASNTYASAHWLGITAGLLRCIALLVPAGGLTLVCGGWLRRVFQRRVFQRRVFSSASPLRDPPQASESPPLPCRCRRASVATAQTPANLCSSKLRLQPRFERRVQGWVLRGRVTLEPERESERPAN